MDENSKLPPLLGLYYLYDINTTMETKTVGTYSSNNTSVSTSFPLTSTSPLPLTSNLDCEIHPLFAYKNGQCLSPGGCGLVRSALRLATMYMNTPSCLAFFATYSFSERTIDDDWNTWLVKESALTTFKAERVKEMLLELDRVIRSTFQNTSNGTEMRGNIWGGFTNDERADIE